MKTEKKERLRGLDEIKGARITLNNLEALLRRSTGEITKDSVLMQIMLMRQELEGLEGIELDKMYADYLKQEQERLHRRVEQFMKCYNAPCKDCHHLYVDCFEPTREDLEEMEKEYVPEDNELSTQ